MFCANWSVSLYILCMPIPTGNSWQAGRVCCALYPSMSISGSSPSKWIPLVRNSRLCKSTNGIEEFFVLSVAAVYAVAEWDTWEYRQSIVGRWISVSCLNLSCWILHRLRSSHTTLQDSHTFSDLPARRELESRWRKNARPRNLDSLEVQKSETFRLDAYIHADRIAPTCNLLKEKAARQVETLAGIVSRLSLTLLGRERHPRLHL